MKRCFIFSAGSFFGLRETPGPGDTVIAADAGLLHCRRAGIKPDLVVGDFDSMPPPEDATLDILRLPVEKDDTDTMMAVKLGLQRGCREFFIYGGTGGKRLDHTLANIQSLAYLCRHGARGYMYDDDFVYTVLENGALDIEKAVDWGLVSIFSLGDRVENVTLEGLQYPLENGVVENSFPIGVSNHITAPSARISAGAGLLLVGWELPAHSRLEDE